MTHRSVDINGVRVVYTDRGTGPPALFLHGNPDSRHSWEPLFDELPEGTRLIAPDFPGFGDSSPLPQEVKLGPAFMAEFWDRFADAVELSEPAHVVVHDFGGPWLLPWVAAHPERVRSVCAINTVFHRDYRWHRWARIWQTPVIGELAIHLATRSLLRREMRAHAPGVSREMVDAVYDRMHRTMRRTVLRTYRAHANPAEVFKDWEERLQAVLAKLPSRAIWGDRDPYLPSSYADRFGGEAIHVAQFGHWIHLQAPALVAGHLIPLWQAGP